MKKFDIKKLEADWEVDHYENNAGYTPTKDSVNQIINWSGYKSGFFGASSIDMIWEFFDETIVVKDDEIIELVDNSALIFRGDEVVENYLENFGAGRDASGVPDVQLHQGSGVVAVMKEDIKKEIFFHTETVEPPVIESKI